MVLWTQWIWFAQTLGDVEGQGKLGMLHSMGSQIVILDCATTRTVAIIGYELYSPRVVQYILIAYFIPNSSYHLLLYP